MFLRRMKLWNASDNGAGGQQTEGNGTPEAGGNGGGSQGEPKPSAQATFTQAQVEAMIAQRLAAEKNKANSVTPESVQGMIAEALSKVQTMEPPQPAPPADVAAGKAEEAKQQAEKLLLQAQQLHTQTALEREAIRIGVSAENLPLLCGVVDLSDVPCSENGADADVIAQKITQALEQFPLLKGSGGGSYSGGGNPGGSKTEPGSLGRELGEHYAQQQKTAATSLQHFLKR